MATTQTSIRFTAATRRQIDQLEAAGHGTITQIVAIAIDRMHREEIKHMTTHTVTIEQKMSGTGSIHDLSNQHFDRHIEFGDDDQYAIVLAAYYGDGNMYYTARDKEDALNLHIEYKDKGYSHAIIDRDGDAVDPTWLYN